MTTIENREHEAGRRKRCANDACPRPAEPADAYCASCGLERSLFTRRGGERESGVHERPVR
jgi:hypothetical protein